MSFASLAMAAWTVAESGPLPLPEPLGSQVPPAVPFTNTPATVLNWFLIADETQGPAIITTRTIIAMTRTYSMAPWPRRRVFLGDPPPRRLIAAACICDTPFAWGLILHAERTLKRTD